MSARSKASGHDIIWDSKNWVYADNGEIANEIRPCAHCGKKPVGVLVKIPADLSHTGKEFWKYAQIDACIAPIVEALQKAGIDMRGSCCGHGEGMGDIHLQDGRALIILSSTEANRHYSKRGRSSKVRTVV